MASGRGPLVQTIKPQQRIRGVLILSSDTTFPYVDCTEAYRPKLRALDLEKANWVSAEFCVANR